MKNKVILYSPPSYFEDEKTVLLANISVTQITPRRKLLKLDNGEIISYGACLIAMGSSPVLPDIPLHKRDKVMTYRNIDNFKKIDSR